jgi:MoaA/NifB/PqqE/SkfB family radical SAM enzyme
MLLALANRMMREAHPRLLWKFLYNFAFKGVRASRRFHRRLAAGDYYPAFLFLSVTSRCNLRCQGCWVSTNGPRADLDAETLDRIIRESKRRGNYFYGILGGEPLLCPALWDVLGRHGDCYFQVFTNGTLLGDETARTMRRLGNVSPLVSIEGTEAVSDERRGGRQVYRRTLEGLRHCRRHRLLTGVATSLCRSNIEDLVSERFLWELVERGVVYLWYYIYRPVGPDPRPDLALGREDIRRVRRFIVEARRRVPLVIVDAYWDERGRALCPAATGVSCHINPWSDIEPCPPIQFAVESVHQNGDLYHTIRDSAFLREFRRFASETTPGCVLLERPDLLRRFLAEQGARDTTGRRTGLAELAAMDARPSHHVPGEEVPETHWFYRFAKKHWYFGFGAYA